MTVHMGILIYFSPEYFKQFKTCLYLKRKAKTNSSKIIKFDTFNISKLMINTSGIAQPILHSITMFIWTKACCTKEYIKGGIEN